MTTVRSAKAKGSSFEYDCQYSLRKTYTNMYRTAERGFQMQYDLEDAFSKVAIECKRLKGISWNQAVKFYEKLVTKAPKYSCFLLFQSNRQPCLVMYKLRGVVTVQTFEDVFKVPFEKHPSTRAK